MIITQEQCLLLESDARFQNVSKQFVRDIATYLSGQNGTAGSTGGLSPEDWAKQRTIGAGIKYHPNNQNYQDWVSQFTMFLKGQDVWVEVTDPDPAVAQRKSIDATIDAMIASGKFDELSNLTYGLRAKLVEF